MADELTIDIHYNKLLDWLVDRRHCDVKWHSDVKRVRDRLSIAVKDLPSSEQFTWVRDIEVLNYFDCVRVFDEVKSEGDSKTIFGQYVVPRVKEWAEILKQYEKNNVYLAECAQALSRMVNYEISSLKQQINRCKQTQRECLRKESELTANSAMFRDKYSTACKALGIEGTSVREELASLVAELPSIFNQVLSDLSTLLPAIVYYQSFVQCITNKSCDEDNFLPLLSYILKHGNVTVYKWKNGTEPQTSMPTAILTELPSNDTIDIDWGESTAGQDIGVVDREPEIDFRDAEIDFGDSNDVDLSCITLEDSGQENVALEVPANESTALEEPANEITALEEPANEITALEEPANEITAPIERTDLETLLESSYTRGLFLNDLMEVKEFLHQRLHELSNDTASVLSVGQFETGSDVLELQTKEGVAEMSSHVTKVLDHLTSQRVQHLFLIKGSHRYLERLSDSLLHNLRLSNKATSLARELVTRREGAAAQAEKLEPKLVTISTRTKQLQAHIASDISRRYKNRVVNIMGEINQI